MNTYFGVGLAALAAAFAAVPAAALAIDNTRCTSVLLADGGCVFVDGNDNDAAAIEALYNPTGKAGSPISLNDIGKINIPEDFDWSVDLVTGVGKLTSADGGLSGTWELFDGFFADFVSVKASNEFRLTKLSAIASSGTWTTLGLCAGQQCKQPELSHIQFFGGQGDIVPEPATWAMMIGGFGLVGASLRRRKTLGSVSA